MTDPAIDLDRPASWPAEIQSLVSEAVQQSDLSEHEAPRNASPPAVMNQVAEPVNDLGLRLYHGTRLPAREAGGISRDGLAPTSADLARRRLASALEEGTITADEAAALEAPHLGDDEWRTGRIFFATSRLALADPAFAAVTERWGGDAALGN